MSWPKYRPTLNEFEERISEDWQAFWLTVAQKKFSGIQKFNHGYAVRARTAIKLTIMVIGARVSAGDHATSPTRLSACSRHELDSGSGATCALIPTLAAV